MWEVQEEVEAKVQLVVEVKLVDDPVEDETHLAPGNSETEFGLE